MRRGRAGVVGSKKKGRERGKGFVKEVKKLEDWKKMT